MNRILLVDDSMLICNYLSKKIRDTLGMEVDVVHTFKDARDKVENNPDYFLALLDVHLPDMNDATMAKYMISKGLKSIVMTADFNESTYGMFSELNIIDYVLKETPETINYILTLIDRVLRNSKIKVLLVDDSITVQKQLKYYLESQLFNVFCANEPIEALSILERHSDIKMVITDYYMPNLTGVEFLKIIRKNFSKTEMSVIGISSNEYTVLNFLKNGANDFVTKPFRKEEFVCRINNVADSLENIAKLNESKNQIKESYQKMQESIQYASLIQQAILPDKNVLNSFCKDSFIFWQPKDTVGGDIYFVSELSKNEILIMVIDGAGHGVPGAFVTMFVKAIEERIVSNIKSGILNPSPALILEYFNKSIKMMLKQEKGSISNTGFDGGILYYNQITNECKYAGAKTPIYIVNDGLVEVIKSDRKNVGFIRTKIDQKYTDHEIDIKEGTKLYISTDGLIDQEAKNHSRYGWSRFEKLIKSIYYDSFDNQLVKLKNSFTNFKQSDDITVVGLEFKQSSLKKLIKDLSIQSVST